MFFLESISGIGLLYLGHFMLKSRIRTKTWKRSRRWTSVGRQKPRHRKSSRPRSLFRADVDPSPDFRWQMERRRLVATGSGGADRFRRIGAQRRRPPGEAPLDLVDETLARQDPQEPPQKEPLDLGQRRRRRHQF